MLARVDELEHAIEALSETTETEIAACQVWRGCGRRRVRKGMGAEGDGTEVGVGRMGGRGGWGGSRGGEDWRRIGEDWRRLERGACVQGGGNGRAAVGGRHWELSIVRRVRVTTYDVRVTT